MRLSTAALLLVVAVSIPATALHAQRSAFKSIAPSATELTTAAQLRLQSNRAHVSERDGLAADIHYARAGRREGETLMIVGGAVLLTGLLVNESLVTIAGAAIGGYGLYVYLSTSPKRK